MMFFERYYHPSCRFWKIERTSRNRRWTSTLLLSLIIAALKRRPTSLSTIVVGLQLHAQDRESIQVGALCQSLIQMQRKSLRALEPEAVAHYVWPPGIANHLKSWRYISDSPGTWSRALLLLIQSRHKTPCLQEPKFLADIGQHDQAQVQMDSVFHNRGLFAPELLCPGYSDNSRLLSS